MSWNDGTPAAGKDLADDEGNLRPEVVRRERSAAPRPRPQPPRSAPPPSGCLLVLCLGLLAALVHACS